MFKATLEEIISNEMSFLFSQYCFKKVSYGYDPKMFGNEALDISNGKTMISFTKDRDQLLVYFGHPGMARPKWYTLHLLLKSKNITGIQEHKFNLPVEEQARHLSPIISQYCTEILLGDWKSEDEIILAGKANAEEVIKMLTSKK